MHALIAAEQFDKYGVIVKKHQPHQQGQWSSQFAKKPKVDIAGIDHESNPDDGDFASEGLLTESSENGDTEVDEAQPSNTEVYFTKWSFNLHSSYLV